MKKFMKQSRLGLIVFTLTVLIFMSVSVLIFSSVFNKAGTVEGVSSVQCLDPFGVASDFNVFVFGDMNEHSVDTQGRVAVGGNATYLNYAIGAALSNSKGTRDDLIVGKKLDFTNGQVINGNIVYGDTIKLTRVGLPNGTARKGNLIDFTAARTDITNRSLVGSSYATTGVQTSTATTLTLKGTNTDFNVFNITTNDLRPNITFTIDAPATSTVLINVNGTNAQFSYMGFKLIGVNKQKVLYNFYNATQLQIVHIGIQGTIMAPKATISSDSSSVDGFVVAESFTGQGEAHQIPFTGCIKPKTTITSTTTLVLTSTTPVVTTTVAQTTAPRITISLPVQTTVPTSTISSTKAVTTTPTLTIVPTTTNIGYKTITPSTTTSTPVNMTTTIIPTPAPTAIDGISMTPTLSQSGTPTVTPQSAVLGASTSPISTLPNTGANDNLLTVIIAMMFIFVGFGIYRASVNKK